MMRTNVQISPWLLSIPIPSFSEATLLSRTLRPNHARRHLLNPRGRNSSANASNDSSSSMTIDKPSLVDGGSKKQRSTVADLSRHEDYDTERPIERADEVANAKDTKSASPDQTNMRRITTRRHRASEDRSETHPRPQAHREHWQVQKEALKQKFGDQGWQPRKKLSPDTMEGIRALHQQFPDKFTTPALAQQFKVSPEAIRRILKSKWCSSPEKAEERRTRWAKRHDRIWDVQSELGLRPQRTKRKKPEKLGETESMIPLMPTVGL